MMSEAQTWNYFYAFQFEGKASSAFRKLFVKYPYSFCIFLFKFFNFISLVLFYVSNSDLSKHFEWIYVPRYLVVTVMFYYLVNYSKKDQTLFIHSIDFVRIFFIESLSSIQTWRLKTVRNEGIFILRGYFEFWFIETESTKNKISNRIFTKIIYKYARNFSHSKWNKQ